MLFSLNWLKEYIDSLPSPGELADRLTMTGTEVEGVEGGGEAVEGVLTAEVLTVEPHPNADKLSLCKVRTGPDEVHSIVCGAKNMKPGDHVPLALPGAVLPGGHRIKKSKLRGVVSEGMMCSEVELGLASEAEGLMILPPETPIGEDINAVVERDVIMELSITPNRADLLSIRGIARELSAVAGGRFTDKVPVVKETGPEIDGRVSVRLDVPEKCGRYTARLIEGVKVGPSPDHIARRLEAVGIRPVNNVVDVTNYVLLELGQPLHAFDFDTLGEATIIVRPSVEGERIETIDGKVRTLPEGTLVIADSTRPVALAGVMGGRETEVGEATTNVLLESAWFEPSVVRRSARETGLSTDSSYRFERGVDIENVTRALDMAAAMITEVAGGTVARGMVDLYPEPFSPKALELRVDRAEELLGIPLTEAEVKELLESLGITVERAEEPAREEVLTVYPPSWRSDLAEEVDLIEEVARLVGYDKIPTTLPATGLIPGGRGRLFNLRNTVKDVLTGAGFFEVINYSFISRDLYGVLGEPADNAVTILNPLSEDQVVMRSSLVPSLLDTLRKNVQRKNEEVRIFELKTVFYPAGDDERLPLESWRVSGLLYGHRWGESWNCPKERVDFFDVKGVAETILEASGVTGRVEFTPLGEDGAATFHPGKSARLVVDGSEAGVLGEIHPDLGAAFDLKHPAYVFELDFDALLAASTDVRMYKPIPRFPASARDIAFVVDGTVPYGEIISSITRLDTKLIEKIELFDVYYGGNIPAGKRSLAIRVVCRSADKTLTQSQVDKIYARISKELTSRFGAEIRGE